MRRSRQSRTSNLDLDVPGCLGNIDRLDTHLTVDNVRFPPCAYLVAQDINPATGAWASRHNTSKTLSVIGAGTNPTYGNATAIDNTAVKYLTSNYHEAADTTWGQITTGDFAFEALLTSNTGSGVFNIVGTRNLAPEVGWSLYQQTNVFVFYLYSNSNFASNTFGAAAYTQNELIHLMVFADRSENLYSYVNGIFASSGAVGSATGDASSTNELIVGAQPNGSYKINSNIIQTSLWDLPTNPFPGALKNRTYFDKIARERFAIVAGIQDRRQGAHTFTRATPAYIDKWIPATSTRGLYRVSAGWPRVCERDDANSKRVRRFLGEPQITNLCIQSEDLATTWTALDLTTINSNAAVAPNGETTADGVVANVTNTAHGVYQPLTLPATNHCLSVFAKPGNKNWIELYTSIANVRAHFDVANGTVGTTGASVTAAGVEPHPYLNGHYRCWICFTGTANAKDYGFFSATSDGNTQFAGDTTTVNTYFWGAQIEATAELFPSSYIPTAAAAVARNKDELSYNVRLPIVGNINDLPQALTIGGNDYQPSAYLVADDVNVSTGAWTSRHAAKSLAYAGAGTNPTPQWDAVSRANTSIKYWASNYHKAADTTWGTFAANDGAIEIICAFDTSLGYILTTNNATTGLEKGFTCYANSGTFRCYLDNGAGTAVSVVDPTVRSGLNHYMICFDRSEKAYLFTNGIYVTSADISGITGDITESALTVAASPAGGSLSAMTLAHAGVWDLGGAIWPGAATNQAVMGAIARARFNHLFRYQSCRLDCEILHPNVNRQVTAVPVSTGVGYPDYQYLGIGSSDVGFAQAVANSVLQWSSGTTLGSTDICNNVSVKLSAKARENLVVYAENNTTQSTDTTAELPAGQTRVLVGQFVDGTIQPTCLVGSVKLSRSDK